MKIAHLLCVGRTALWGELNRTICILCLVQGLAHSRCVINVCSQLSRDCLA